MVKLRELVESGLDTDIEVDEDLLNRFQLPDSQNEQPTESTETVVEEKEDQGSGKLALPEALQPGPDPRNMTREELLAKKERLSTPLGFVKETLTDSAKLAAKQAEYVSAGAVGVSDTLIDLINFASADGGKYDIPKIPDYESKTSEAIRDISGLVIPMLGIKAKIIQTGSRIHAAGKAAPWLQKLGNRKSFDWFARFGADIGSGALVDYVAEQNKEDHNLAGTLKKYWPRTFQWIPDRIATTDSDSPDLKRSKNVNEGAIFGLLSSVVEGVAFITKAGRSVKDTSKFITKSEAGGKSLKQLTEDQFTNIVFDPDNPMTDSILRNQARKEYELDLLGQYFSDASDGKFTEPTLGVHDVFDETETLIRTKDPDGVIGASIDAAQIKNNVDTSWGRLSNTIHEAARKQGIELENLSNRTLVAELTDQIKKAGKVGKKLNSGKTITANMVDDAGKNLAAILLNPQVEPDQIIRLLDNFNKAVEGSAARIVGKRGVNIAIKELTKQITDLDVQKARAYLVTSEAGQISDMAEGFRLMEGNKSLVRTVDAMADRLEVLMVEKGLAQFEANSLLSNMQSWKQAVKTGDKNVMNATADTILAAHSQKLREIIPQAKKWTNTIKEVSKEQPQFLRSLMLASEMADGNVDTLYKLHKWAGEDSLGVFNKAFIDGHPEVPSIVNQAMWSNLFNSWLSSTGTPVRALVGNLTGLLGYGSQTVVGHVVTGDLVRAKQAMIAHFALDNTLQQALNHMRLVFRKVSTAPKEFKYLSRKDIALKEVKGDEVIREYAKAAEARGELGPNMLLSLYDDLDAISADPALRFSSNAMTAFDGFTQSINANTEAKFRSIWKIQEEGRELTEETLREAQEEIYSKMFNAEGLVSDEAVKTATSVIALNADSPIVDSINELLRRFPAFKSVILFPRTQGNIIKVFGDWSPVTKFNNEYRFLWGDNGKKGLTDGFKDLEIKNYLSTKGIQIDKNYMEQFIRHRAMAKGRLAISRFFVTMAALSAIDGRCTGWGHYDKSRQRSRVKQGWKQKSCKAPGGAQVSYEWMGPIGDWLATTVDIVDNFDNLSTGQFEDLLGKMSWIFASVLGNRSNLAAFEPLHDIFQGNGAAMTRLSSNLANHALPLGGLRQDVSKLLNPSLRVVRNDLADQLRNRNGWLDIFDPQGALPEMYDYVTGEKIGYQENWFMRALNRSGLIKIHPKITPEKQFLIDIEYNITPSLKISRHGAVLKPDEISAIHSLMGQQGEFKANLKKVIRRANNFEYEGHVGFVNIIKAQRRGLVSSDVLDSSKFLGIFDEINSIYLNAKNLAELNLPDDMRNEITRREYIERNKSLNTERGDLDALYQDAYPELEEILNLAK